LVRFSILPMRRLAAIPRAEQLYDDYLTERKKEMGL
jgi:hypothetical protein